MGVIRRRKNELRIGNRVVGIVGGGTQSGALNITFTECLSSNEMTAVASSITLKGKKGTPGVRDVQFQLKAATVMTGTVAVKRVSLL